MIRRFRFGRTTSRASPGVMRQAVTTPAACSSGIASRTCWRNLHSSPVSEPHSSRNPHRIGLERLRELCGSETGELWRFRQQVREAMPELQAAGVLTAWRITPGDALEVVRPNRKRRIIEGESSPNSG